MSKVILNEKDWERIKSILNTQSHHRFSSNCLISCNCGLAEALAIKPQPVIEGAHAKEFFREKLKEAINEAIESIKPLASEEAKGLIIECDGCHETLTKPGIVKIVPTDSPRFFAKFHYCIKCHPEYPAPVRSAEFVQVVPNSMHCFKCGKKNLPFGHICGEPVKSAACEHDKGDYWKDGIISFVGVSKSEYPKCPYCPKPEKNL